MRDLELRQEAHALPGPPRAVVFDLDGTLIDSRHDIATAANHALERHGYPTLPVETLAGFVGDGARWLLARAARLPYESHRLEALQSSFLSYYTAHAVDATEPVDGVVETLAALSPLPLAVCTNKPRRTTEVVLRQLGLLRHFQVVVAGGDLPRLKPDPLPLTTVAERLGLAPHQLVMVGDGPQDIECGQLAGARTIGIPGPMLPGTRLREASPDKVLACISEVPALLTTWGCSPCLASVDR